jgi:hypothetical protein
MIAKQVLYIEEICEILRCGNEGIKEGQQSPASVEVVRINIQKKKKK